MKYTKKLKSQKKEWASLMIILWSLCVITPFAEAQIGGTNTGALVIGADSTYITGNIVNQSTGRIYLGKNEHGKMTKCLILTGNYEGVEGSEIHLSAISPSNHGYFKISGTATGSTKIILDLDKDWNGDRIDLIEVASTNNSSDAFIMDNTTAATSGQIAILKNEIRDDGKHYWFIESGIILKVRAFLEGTLRNSTTMTNYLQVGGSNSEITTCRLPKTDPYGFNAVCNNIHNTAVIGQIVDWVKIELRDATDPSVILATKALLLRTTGEIVDVDGSDPHFSISSQNVQVVVSHRNHLSVLSYPVTPDQNNVVTYDFTTGKEKAFKVLPDDPEQMHETFGVSCLWGGDADNDEQITYMDDNIVKYEYTAMDKWDNYFLWDLNLNGIADENDDNIITKNNEKGGLYSTILNL